MLMLTSENQDKESSNNNDRNLCVDQALIEIISYMEVAVKEGKHLFLLSDLYNMHVEKLNNQGLSNYQNRTRFKEEILSTLKNAREERHGKNVVIVFDEGVQAMLSDALSLQNSSKEAFLLAKTAKLIRRDIFQNDPYTFKGQFENDCQTKCLPKSLVMLVSMILQGTTTSTTNQDVKTIGQALMGRVRGKPSEKAQRLRIDTEAPLNVMIGFKIHYQTRSKTLAQFFHVFFV